LASRQTRGSVGLLASTLDQIPKETVAAVEDASNGSAERCGELLARETQIMHLTADAIDEEPLFVCADFFVCAGFFLSVQVSLSLPVSPSVLAFSSVPICLTISYFKSNKPELECF